MKNKFTGTVVEFHILQSFPVSCLNRDDVGAPKSALIGGTERARVSSQCWKRAVREKLHELGVKTAIRTRYVTDAIARACVNLGATPEQAQSCGEAVAKVFTKKVDKGVSDTLLFISDTECVRLAEYCQSNGFAADVNDKELLKICKSAINPAHDGLDIALFGRMVASAADLNIEAAASFAHAISTHRVTSEMDFFTAVDDCNTEGSAHMGTLEFNSATYYRYISLDLGQLAATLGTEQLDDALAAFTQALFLAVPKARQATMAAHCPWEYAVVTVRQGQRVQLPFNTAVCSTSQEHPNLLTASKTALNTQLAELEHMYGSLFGLRKRFELGFGHPASIDDLVAGLQQTAAGL